MVSKLARRSRYLQRRAANHFKEGLNLSREACEEDEEGSLFGKRVQAREKLAAATQHVVTSLEIANSVRRMKGQQELELDVKEALHDVVFRGKVFK